MAMPSHSRYAAATDRFVVQLGDLTDYGPDNAGVLRLMFRLIDEGRGLFLLGNHDLKLARFLAGQPVRNEATLDATLAQLDADLAPTRGGRGGHRAGLAAARWRGVRAWRLPHRDAGDRRAGARPGARARRAGPRAVRRADRAHAARRLSGTQPALGRSHPGRASRCIAATTGAAPTAAPTSGAARPADRRCSSTPAPAREGICRGSTCERRAGHRRGARHRRRDRGTPGTRWLARGGRRHATPHGAAPPGGRYVVCDVADEAAVGALIAEVTAQDGRLDALVCNAGINIRKPIAQLTLAEWSRVIGTNLTSTFLLTRAAEAMLRAAQGVRRDDRIHARPYVGGRHRSLCRVEGRAGGADACAVDQPCTGRAGELHQPRLDLHQGRRRRGRRTTHSIPPAASARRRTSRRWSRSWWGRRAASSPAPSSSSMAA